MSTPSPDDKILQLVKAILDAVDTRLAAVRQEFAGAVQQMEQRHRQVLDALAAFDRRINALQSPTSTAAPRSTASTASTAGAAPASVPTLRADTPAPGAAAAPAPAAAATQGDSIDLTEVARLVQERLGNLTLPSLDPQPDR